MNRLFKRLLACIAVVACAALAGCATTDAESESMFAPTAISDMYSGVTMRIKLAFTPGERRNHFDNPELECSGPTLFEQRVTRIGTQLGEAAYRTYPDLSKRIPRFVFSVSDKLEPGVASTAGGLIVVLKPVNDISLSDDALAFVIAREMGHVISRHHEQNTAISIAISLAATALAPALGLARLLAFISTNASTAAAASQVTSSAASFAGSQAAIASYGNRQRKASDGVAVQLMPLAGYNAQRVAAGLVADCPQESPTTWLREYHESIALLAPPTVALNSDAKININTNTSTNDATAATPPTPAPPPPPPPSE